MRLSCLLAACLAAASLWAQPFPYELEKDRAPKTVTKGNCLIKHARVLTATKGSFDDTDVLVENGKIAKIGRNLSAPAGVVVIDATGKALAPGIVDGHSHRASDGTNEGAESITCEVRIGDVLNPSALNIWHALASGHTTAMILHGSANAVGGESQVIKYKYQRPVKELLFPGAPRMVKFALGENVTQKSSTDSTRYPRTRMGVETVYRRAFTRAREYAAAWDAFRSGRTTKKPRLDLRLQTLADILAQKVWVQCHSYRSDEMLMMVRLSQEFGFKIGAMQHALEAYKIAPELAKAGVGVSIFVDNWSFKMEGYDSIPWNAAICAKAGVNVSINTDGTGGTTALNVDAAKTMRFGGFSEEEALQTITINPAKELGVDRQTGSIEVGKDADLAIWSGSPMSVYAKCLMTIIDGEVFFERKDSFGVDAGAPGCLKLPKQVNRGEAKPLPKSDAYAIVGATVYPVASAPISGGTVVIEHGKITKVGRDVSIPNGAKVVSGRGLRVYPGFFDAWSPMGLGEISPVPAMMDISELGANQPDLDAATALWVESTHYGPARYNGITNVFTGPISGTIAGQGAVIQTYGFTTEELTVRRKAALMVSLGGVRAPIDFDICDDVSDASQLLGLGGGPGEGYFGDEKLTQEQRDRYYDMLGGAQDFLQADPGSGPENLSMLDEAREYLRKKRIDPEMPEDLKLEALKPYLMEKRLVVVPANSPAQIRNAVATAKKYGLRIAIRGGSSAWKEAKLLADEKIPVILVPAGKSTLNANAPDNPWDPYDTTYASAAWLIKNGVKVCFGTGSPADSMNLAVRVGQHCGYGLSQADALRAITLTPAEVFGVSDQIGSIEEGKSGTLIVTDGDPFELTTSIRYAFIDGRPASMVTKHTQLRDKYLERVK